DEPTNDLDVESLDLLQELIGEYDGTVILVSHDRDFLDRVASVTLALEGDGLATTYAGGWSDYQAQRRDRTQKPGRNRKLAEKSASSNTSKAKTHGLTFTEKHRLEELPGEIERLEREIHKLTAVLSDPDLFSREPIKFRKASEALSERQTALTQAEDDWLRLEEKADASRR
ncbi:MAG: ABC transporter ATP-binding protein, partial [Pseudomonadota bacterium]